MNRRTDIRVLHVVHALGMGGAETWLMHLVRYWKKGTNKYPQIDFLITGGQPSIFDAEAKDLGSKLFYLDLKSGKVLKFVRELRKILRDNKYDAIHDHQDFISGWHFLFGAGLLPGVKITHVHNPSYQLRENYGTSFRRRLQIRFGKFLVKKYATHIGGTSAQVLREYGISERNYSKQWIGAIHCAFPIEEWRGAYYAEAKSQVCSEMEWPIDCKVILFAGRLDYSLGINHPQNHKNSVFALHVLENAVKYGDIRMIMAGANEYILKDFESLIDSKGLSNSVKLVGIRTDMPKLMLGSDLLLFPSRGEGLGMVAVEAQAAGLSVLASTAVPKECVVIEELVHFCDLNQPLEEWSKMISLILSKPKDHRNDIDTRWKTSMFNITQGSDLLIKLYQGRLSE